MYKARYNHRIPHKIYLDLSNGYALLFNVNTRLHERWVEHVYMGEDWKWLAKVISPHEFFDLLTYFGFIVNGKIVEDL